MADRGQHKPAGKPLKESQEPATADVFKVLFEHGIGVMIELQEILHAHLAGEKGKVMGGVADIIGARIRR